MAASRHPQPADTPEPAEQPALVIANFGADVDLLTERGDRVTATPLKKLGMLVTGDRVVVEIDGSTARVREREERRTTLSRTDRNGKLKPVAANLTQLVVVTAPAPPFDPMLIDRYLVAARQIGVDVTIVINKTDLLDDGGNDTPDNSSSAAQADAIETLYTGIGYPVLRTCLSNGDGVNALIERLHDHVSILVGQSGVGKSSLLNRLIPDLDVRTGALSSQSGLGRHTTSVTTWFALPDGGAIIDSAGVRQFSLDHIPHADIQSGFIEISEAAQHCKFNNCTHQHEPECAVQEALKAQQISPQRFEHFTVLRESSVSANQMY
jgi:ribosome biogenesis GTPase